MMNIVDVSLLKDNCPKAYQRIVDKFQEQEKALNDQFGIKVIDIALSSRTACLEQLDKENIIVTVDFAKNSEGEKEWMWFIDSGGMFCESRDEQNVFDSRGDAEVDGIYKGFEILEEKL